MEKNFGELASQKIINIAKNALEKNGFEVFVVENGKEAKEKALQIIPQDAEIMNMTSETADAIGLSKEILESEKYNAVRNKFKTMASENRDQDMKKLGAAPEWAVGSVHAITQDGKVIVASATGSQLPAYAYGAGRVLWIAGAQKIVKNLEEGMQRIYEYVLPRESERATKAYGQPSSVNKLLIFNKEVTPGRITIIIIKEKLGF